MASEESQHFQERLRGEDGVGSLNVQDLHPSHPAPPSGKTSGGMSLQTEPRTALFQGKWQKPPVAEPMTSPVL